MSKVCSACVPAFHSGKGVGWPTYRGGCSALSGFGPRMDRSAKATNALAEVPVVFTSAPRHYDDRSVNSGQYLLE